MGKKCKKPKDDWQRKGLSSRAANWELFSGTPGSRSKSLHDSQSEHFDSLKDAVLGRWVTPLDNIWYLNEKKSKVEDCSLKFCGMI